MIDYSNVSAICFDCASIKQARYMMNCLDSYIPDYNKKGANDYNCMNTDYINQIETPFWCPISKKVRR